MLARELRVFERQARKLAAKLTPAALRVRCADPAFKPVEHVFQEELRRRGSAELRESKGLVVPRVSGRPSKIARAIGCAKEDRFEFEACATSGPVSVLSAYRLLLFAIEHEKQAIIPSVEALGAIFAAAPARFTEHDAALIRLAYYTGGRPESDQLRERDRSCWLAINKQIKRRICSQPSRGSRHSRI
jgi:hypothetical protein